MHLYMQVKNKMLDSFKDLTYFSPLPGERDLCKKFGVSRPTIRKVLEMLEKENTIVRLQGKGSFFLGNKIHVEGGGSQQIITFYDEVISHGKYTKSKILMQDVRKPSESVAVQLAIGIDDDVFHLERLRYIGEQLYSIAKAYIPFHFCPELLKEDFTNKSLHATLEKYGIYPYKQKKVLDIRPATHYEVLHLEINNNDPVSVMRTLTFTKDNTLIEYAVSRSLAYNTRYEMTSYKAGHDNTMVI